MRAGAPTLCKKRAREVDKAKATRLAVVLGERDAQRRMELPHRIIDQCGSPYREFAEDACELQASVTAKAGVLQLREGWDAGAQLVSDPRVFSAWVGVNQAQML